MKFNKSAIAMSIVAAMAISGCTPETEDDKKNGGSGNKTNPQVVLPSISIEPKKTFNEPADGAKVYPVKINLSTAAKEVIKINYSIDAVTATSGADFVDNSGTLEIPVGARSVDIDLTINGDNLDEDVETFTVTLRDPEKSTLRKGYEVSTIYIVDEDPDVVVNFETDFAQVAEGSGVYKIKVQLSTPSEKDVRIPFTISGLATHGQDFNLITSSPITVPAGSDEVEIALDFISDTIPEGGESVVLSLQGPTNASLGQKREAIIMIPGDVSLNDTGVTTWFDGYSFESKTPNGSHPGQDAEFGIDAENQASFDGHAGFSFTKIDMSGNALPSNDNSYKCVQDNRTGLTWEVKENSSTLPTLNGEPLKELLDNQIADGSYQYFDAHRAWRSTNYQYYWYNKAEDSNGGAEGTEGDLFVKSTHPISAWCAFPEKNMTNYMTAANRCNTERYVEAMNMLAVCGYKDWRMPTIEEMRSIHNYRATAAEVGEVNYFPNVADGDYISGTPSADGTGSAWCINSGSGQVKLCNKQFPNYIRVVRGGSQ